MLVRKAGDIRSSEITDKKLYLRRREFIKAAAAGSIGIAAAANAEAAPSWPRVKIPSVQKTAYAPAGEKPNSYEDITSYNNYYEFGTEKNDPSNNAGTLKTKPWTIKVDGLVAKPADYQLEDFIKPYALEERIYRMRCVEAWSMVIPWVGIPLANILKAAQPQGTAKFVEFTTLFNPQQMPGQRRAVLQWPYVEGLRLDEAMNPLAILAVGVYGEFLPNQNGAPLRLVVPWKYGFKGIKSIVRMRLTDKQPMNSWQLSAPQEYGFYANVNPAVDHPRWSQARERRIGEFLKRPTLPFNGYADQVASLYSSLDPRKLY